MMPLWASTASGFTSGTTRGTPGSILHAEELSTTMAPSDAAMGASTRLASAPAEKRAISTSLKAPLPAALTSTSPPLYLTFLPAISGMSMGMRVELGKFLPSRVLIISVPTAPRAPTTATLYIDISPCDAYRILYEFSGEFGGDHRRLVIAFRIYYRDDLAVAEFPAQSIDHPHRIANRGIG